MPIEILSQRQYPLDNAPLWTYITYMSNELSAPSTAPSKIRKKPLSDLLITLRDMTNPVNSVRQKVLQAAASGATLKQCAHSAGLTVPELQQVLKWGEDGHPAWEGLFRKYMATSAEVQVEIVERMKEEVMVKGSVEHANFVLQRLNPEEYSVEPRTRTGAGGGGNTVTVRIQTDFGEVVDAEEVEEL
jgi:hypothetical protein